MREDEVIDEERDCVGLVLPLLEKKGDALLVGIVVKEFRIVAEHTGVTVDDTCDEVVSDRVTEEVNDIGGDCVKDTRDDSVAED